MVEKMSYVFNTNKKSIKKKLTLNMLQKKMNSILLINNNLIQMESLIIIISIVKPF